MQKLAAEPTDASRKALAAIRVRYAIALSDEARRARDQEMYVRALHCAHGAVNASP